MVNLYSLLLVTLLLIGVFFILMGITLHPITPILCMVAGCGIVSGATFCFAELWAAMRNRRKV